MQTTSSQAEGARAYARSEERPTHRIEGFAVGSGLARVGATLDEVRGVVVTHARPDHYGLAPRIREHTSAWIGTRPGERGQIRVDAADRRARLAEISDWLLDCGLPAASLAELDGELARRPGSDPDPLRDFLASLRRLDRVPDSAVVLPGHEWPFDRLSRRLDVLRAHHDERLAQIEQPSYAGATRCGGSPRRCRGRGTSRSSPRARCDRPSPRPRHI